MIKRHTLEILQVQFQTTTINKPHNKMSCNLFAGGGSCLQFVKKKKSNIYEMQQSTIKQGMPVLTSGFKVNTGPQSVRDPGSENSTLDLLL